MNTNAAGSLNNALEQRWYVAANGQATGPFPGTQLRDMIARGEVTPRSLVCVVGASDWTEAGAIPDLAGLFADRSPPLPPTAPPLPPAQPYDQRFSSVSQPAQVSSQPVLNGNVRYAGFWIRAAAYLIDFVIMFVLMLVPLIIVMMVTGNPNSGLGTLVTVIVGICYFVIPVSGPKQATWGKQMLGLKIIRAEGGAVGGGLAFGRYLAYMLSSIPLCLGFFMIGWNREKKGLHDIVCGTRVVYKN